MGRAHLAALQGLGVSRLTAFAASERNRAKVESMGIAFHHGSLASALEAAKPTHVVVATPVEHLAATAATILAAGVRNVLIEKPAVLTRREAQQLADAKVRTGARIHVGYNRRFYASVRTARRLIRESGEPVASVQFEFTEWPHAVEPLTNQSPGVKARWLLANSMHVIDLAFLPVGLPDMAASRFLTQGALGWHPTASVFAGAGRTKGGALYSYGANWDAPGRWGVEWMTRSTRYVFRPMEKLHVVRRGSVAVEEVAPDDDLDQHHKPGVFLQARAFLTGEESSDLPPLDHAVALVELSAEMAGYAID
jgi:predicted dehydrogenase